MTPPVNLVHIQPVLMEDWEKETSVAVLTALIEQIQNNEISGFVYVACSPNFVYNDGVGYMNDPYRILGLLDQTKGAIVSQLLYPEDDE